MRLPVAKTLLFGQFQCKQAESHDLDKHLVNYPPSLVKHRLQLKIGGSYEHCVVKFTGAVGDIPERIPCGYFCVWQKGVWTPHMLWRLFVTALRDCPMVISKVMRLTTVIMCAVVCFGLHSVLMARDWTDVTGRHRFSGDLIAASPETAVIRNSKGDLEAYIVEELSESDQKFIHEYVQSKSSEIVPEQMHTWTGREGYRFRGRVIGYGSQDIVLGYDRGKFRVNKKSIDEIDQIYQKMIPKIVAQFDDDSVVTEKDLNIWGRKLHGKEKSFRVDGVMMRLEDGEKVAVPLFLFSDEERIVLEQGWDTWNAESTKENERKRESFLAEASAAEFQRNQQAQAKTNQQIQMMQLGMMAANSGLTNVWQVQMLPRPGVRARPMSVVIPAGNSAQASTIAAQKYPAFVPGIVRQMNY